MTERTGGEGDFWGELLPDCGLEEEREDEGWPGVSILGKLRNAITLICMCVWGGVPYMESMSE